MKVNYIGRTYSISIDMAKMIHQPLEYLLDNQRFTEPERESDPSSETESNNMAKPQSSPQSSVVKNGTGLKLKLYNYRHGDPTPETIRPFTKPETSITRPTVRNPQQEGGPATRTRPRTTSTTNFPTDLKVFHADGGLARDEQIKRAFNEELQS